MSYEKVFNPPPGWPPAPEGFVPDADWLPDPSWPLASLNWVWWKHPTEKIHPASAQIRPPRSAGARLVLMLVGAAAIPVGFVLALNAAAQSVDPYEHGSYSEYLLAVDDAVSTVGGLCFFASLSILAYISTRVSFRVRDVLVILIPFFGVIQYIRLFWRLAYLPYRDWALRPDELRPWCQSPDVQAKIFRQRGAVPDHSAARR